MITRLPDGIEISSAALPWTATYDTSRCSGPAPVVFHGTPLIHRIRSSLDSWHEDAAAASRCRARRRGRAAQVRTACSLPIGVDVAIAHTHDYSAHAVRLITDVTIPPAMELKQGVAVDSLSLPPSYTAWRELTRAGTLGPWQAIPTEGLTWDHHPLAIILQRDDGVELEIGVGVDIWRWQAGFAGAASNRGRYELRPSTAGFDLLRYPTLCVEPLAPEARDYRFSSYLAWRDPATPASAPASADIDGAIEVPWRGPGDLDRNALADALDRRPDAPLLFDLAHVPRPEAWERSSDTALCLSYRKVMSRLKRALRQFNELPLAGRTIHVDNLYPGCCDADKHLNQRRPTPHWDLTGILQFALWARQCLGPDVTLQNTIPPQLDLPSLHHLFADGGHDR